MYTDKHEYPELGPTSSHSNTYIFSFSAHVHNKCNILRTQMNKDI